MLGLWTRDVPCTRSTVRSPLSPSFTPLSQPPTMCSITEKCNKNKVPLRRCLISSGRGWGWGSGRREAISCWPENYTSVLRWQTNAYVLYIVCMYLYTYVCDDVLHFSITSRLLFLKSLPLLLLLSSNWKLFDFPGNFYCTKIRIRVWK